MAEQFGQTPPPGGPGMPPPPGSPAPQGGVDPGVPQTGVPPTAGPGAGASVTPQAVAPQWQPQSVGATNLGDQPVVSVGARVGARLIDALVLIIIGVLPYSIAVAIAANIAFSNVDPIVIQQNPLSAQETLTPAIGVATLFVFLPIYFINEVVLVKMKGCNIGKLILGQRVVDAKTGSALSWGRAFIRFAVLYTPNLLAAILGIFVSQQISFLLTMGSGFWHIALMVSIALGGALFQGWHDKAAGSKVVKKPAF